MLRQVQLCDTDAVIDLGRGADAVGALSQVDFIQVQFQYFALAQLPFYFNGKENFIEFAHIGFFPGQEKIARHLHGDGAAALFFLTGQQQRDRGTRQTLPVHTRVVEETVVFRGDKCLQQLFGNFLDSYRHAPFLTELSNQ